MLDVSADSPGGIRFTPDGTAAAYLARTDGTDSIHIQPLDGSAPRVIISANEGLGAFRWSPDGSKLAVERQRVDSDVVLLRNAAAQRR
jgi:Tol biopolymer transport system component